MKRIKLILPALTEATSPYWRPIKYSLFPPLGLATLAAYLDPSLQISLHDEHVEKLDLDDEPDLVIIQVYITNAYRAYKIADHYRARGAYVALGGLHVTSLPAEAAPHADTILLGPGEYTFPSFLHDLAAGTPRRRYESSVRTLQGLPPIRRDLIQRHRYLVPNSIVVSRGCPHHCTFCYKDGFFEGGRSFYTQAVDDALAEIARLPGRHLYFLDDHLLGNPRFARDLFRGMRGMGRVFQGAATVDSILRDDVIEEAAAAGLRSLFVGFETLSSASLAGAGKRQNLNRSYREVVRRLDNLGIMINGSFVFGLDGDDRDVFSRTVDWAVQSGLTTSTFHILTPYPGTALFTEMETQQRIATRNWDLYDTRNVVYRPTSMTPEELKRGYDWSYESFYRWRSIFNAASAHESIKHRLKHFFYSAGWKKFEPGWDLVIRIKQLSQMRPILEAVLAPVGTRTSNVAPPLAQSQISMQSSTPDGVT
ncbi:MAG: B12-binding domain-containing radical SAM protein [Acidobacteria bacterium]|nr:B12-binding domain-containing radical SAM protein [Acidobacteriota bacterium]MBV9067297.1 B12-binding domain-containing radical SAM protein [Acidobacteriota bacterium]MBV9186516.1 B12-binding domain-containing radical SAM protein [Acidobacteriota bacterium]